MPIPHAVLAAGWIPFTVVVVLTILFSWFYIRFYQARSYSEVSSTLTAIAALVVSLLTSALVPVDIFLVSYMKNANGTWKDWSVNQTDRDAIEETAVVSTYYVLYSLLAFFVFVLIPFMYFYFEEKDDDVTVGQRMCGALKYSVCFLIIASVLLLVGAFAPLKQPPSNVTDWDKKLLFLKDELRANNGETALSLLIGFLSFIGMLVMITYTAYGMTALPFGMLRGFKSAKREERQVSSRQEANQERARMIRAKYMGGQAMSSRDRRTLSRLEGEEEVLVRRQRHLKASRSGCFNKCLKCCRPIEMVFGVLFLLLSLLIFVSLFITCLDKAVNSLGYKYGYALPKPQLLNPINIVMVFAQKVFPLDYCLFVGVVMYFLFSSMAGMKRMGIRCCWIKLYKIRAGKTYPQALLFMCVMLMLTVLSLNIMLFTLAPQYVMYGNQHYTVYTNTTQQNQTTLHVKTKVCSTAAPPDECTVTRIAVFLNRFFYKVWFFGACYYWGTWVFLGMFVIGLIVSVVKKRQSVVDEELDSSDSDSDGRVV